MKKNEIINLVAHDVYLYICTWLEIRIIYVIKFIKKYKIDFTFLISLLIFTIITPNVLVFEIGLADGTSVLTAMLAPCSGMILGMIILHTGICQELSNESLLYYATGTGFIIGMIGLIIYSIFLAMFIALLRML